MGALTKLRKELRDKKFSLTEFYQDYFKKIYERNKATNAYLSVYEDEVLIQAKEADKKPRDLPLFGLPFGIKDMISIKNRPLQASSWMLEGYRAPQHATVSERLENAGAFFVGRANCDEFAMGSSNENTPYGVCHNPWNLKRSSGGSSGGSAVCVAADMAVGSLGTDTGGSIRLPANFCGIVGMKPTYGRVSRSGVIAFASSLDQVGPLADDVEDCAEILQVIAGRDGRDSTSMDVPVDDYIGAVKKPELKGLKVGLPKEFFEDTSKMDPEISKQNEKAIEVLKKEGAILKEVSLKHAPYGIAVYYLVATAEAASNLARYDGVRYGHRSERQGSLKELIIQSRSEGFGDEVLRRIMLGTFSLSAGYYDAYYQKAQFVRSLVQQEYLSAFKEVDLIYAPVCPYLPFEIGCHQQDPLQMYLADIFTVSVNLAGLPAISFPIGWTDQNLPIGGQLIGNAFQEAKLFSAASAFEKANPVTRGQLAC